MSSSHNCLPSHLFTLCLFGCAVPTIVNAPAPPPLPETWGEYAQNSWGASECPRISGVFHLIPSKYEATQDKNAYREGSESDFYSIFAFHVADRSSQPLNAVASEPDLFSIQQSNPGQFVLQSEAPAVSELISHKFLAVEGDFECKNGFIEFPVSGHYGMVEGMSLNGQDVRRFRLTLNGDLVAILSWGPYRSRRSADFLDFVHEFYLFERAESEKQ